MDSLRGQTWKDTEVLWINDGSADGSGKICDEFAKDYENVRVIHTENRGVSAARNLGLEEAKGEYGVLPPNILVLWMRMIAWRRICWNIWHIYWKRRAAM